MADCRKRMMTIWKNRDFRELKIWQRAHELVRGVYSATSAFPNEERFGLTRQIRRAAVSTAANIVEGSKRRSKEDFTHFLNMAQGSNEEVQYFLLLSKDLGFLKGSALDNLTCVADEVGAMLHSFIKGMSF